MIVNRGSPSKFHDDPDILAARRPTVTDALNKLERSGEIARVDGGLLLKGSPPIELRELAGIMRQLSESVSQ